MARDHIAASRTTDRYQTDLTDEEWRVIEPHLPAPKNIGRPRGWSMREIINGIFYVMSAGCPWRLFLSHLHSLMVTMSQKSSVPQPPKSVSQALMPDTIVQEFCKCG